MLGRKKQQWHSTPVYVDKKVYPPFYLHRCWTLGVTCKVILQFYNSIPDLDRTSPVRRLPSLPSQSSFPILLQCLLDVKSEYTYIYIYISFIELKSYSQKLLPISASFCLPEQMTSSFHKAILSPDSDLIHTSPLHGHCRHMPLTRYGSHYCSHIPLHFWPFGAFWDLYLYLSLALPALNSFMYSSPPLPALRQMHTLYRILSSSFVVKCWLCH